MARLPIINNLRVVPRDSDFLGRKLGSRGEIYYDQDNKTLRVYDGTQTGGYSMAIDDLSNVSDADFLTKATAAGVGGGSGSFELTIAADDSTVRTITSGNTLQFVGANGISTTSADDGTITIENTGSKFTTFAVDGQTNVVADTASDTLTLVAGSNVTITTDADNDSITISATPGGGGGNAFGTIAVSGQTNVVAESSGDTLTLVAGAGISLTTNAATDTVTITNAVSSVSDFTDLTEVQAGNFTIDQTYMPAITMLTVTNSGSSAYLFDQYTGNNPTVYALNGATIAFKLSGLTGHPFEIQDPTATPYNTGLIHVDIDGTVSTGASAQGKTQGTLYWKIPSSISGGYRYQCQAHSGMVGSISIKNFGSI